MRVARERRHAVGPRAQAPQHQRRIQRDRIEGAGGQAQEGAIGQAGGDDGDAGGELRQGLAEMRRVELTRSARKVCASGVCLGSKRSGGRLAASRSLRGDAHDNGSRAVLPCGPDVADLRMLLSLLEVLNWSKVLQQAT
jgi:hypothetical protein